MSNPLNLQYTESHEWVEWIDETTARVGLTDHAQHALSDIVFVNLPEVGDEAAAGETIADVESVKAVSDVYSPVTGTVREINEELLDAPQNINQSPYEAWLFVVENVTDKEEMMDAGAYEHFLEENAD